MKCNMKCKRTTDNGNYLSSGRKNQPVSASIITQEKPMKEEQEYIVYKGDKVIGVGTQEELAKMLNIKKSSVYTLCTPSQLKLAEKSKNRRRAYLIE